MEGGRPRRFGEAGSVLCLSVFGGKSRRGRACRQVESRLAREASGKKIASQGRRSSLRLGRRFERCAVSFQAVSAAKSHCLLKAFKRPSNTLRILREASRTETFAPRGGACGREPSAANRSLSRPLPRRPLCGKSCAFPFNIHSEDSL